MTTLGEVMEEGRRTRGMMAQWRAWHAEQLELALEGDSGVIVLRIIEIVHGLTPSKMPTLVRLIDEVDWRLVNADVRFVILHELNAAIAELCEREGRPPFDDALPFSDEKPTPFQIVRDMLSCTSRENPA